eukprot:6195132-Pleurochrysis_carterae.AAC.2
MEGERGGGEQTFLQEIWAARRREVRLHPRLPHGLLPSKLGVLGRREAGRVGAPESGVVGGHGLERPKVVDGDGCAVCGGAARPRLRRRLLARLGGGRMRVASQVAVAHRVG